MFDSEPVEEYRPGATAGPAAGPTALLRPGLCREATVGDNEICAVCCAEYEPGENTFRLPCKLQSHGIYRGIFEFGLPPLTHRTYTNV